MSVYPSEQTWWPTFEREVQAKYAARGRALDLQAFRWWARTGFDIGAGMDAEQSKAKHLRELDQELGAHDQPIPQPPGMLGTAPRLRRDGRWLVSDAGRFHWRGVTAFRLAHMIVNREDVRPFLDWCAANGVNLVRVLVMCKNMFALSPSQGKSSLPQLLQVAHDRGIYVEVCCLADTFAYPGEDWSRHVEDIGSICYSFPNTLLQGANEPLQHWQAFTPEKLASMVRRVTVSVPCTLGGPDGSADESRAYILPEADYGTAHTDRAGDWRKVRHIRELQVTADDLSLYMVDDEPENASRYTEAQLFAAGAIAAVGRIGQTHHADWGKACTLPTPDEQRQFNARRRGWDTVPAAFDGTFANYGWTAPNPEPPIAKATLLNDDSRVYSRVNDREAYVVLVHATGPVLKPGWTGTIVDAIDTASVLHCTR